jgi:hypothetical protein
MEAAKAQNWAVEPQEKKKLILNSLFFVTSWDGAAREDSISETFVITDFSITYRIFYEVCLQF